MRIPHSLVWILTAQEDRGSRCGSGRTGSRKRDTFILVERVGFRVRHHTCGKVDKLALWVYPNEKDTPGVPLVALYVWYAAEENKVIEVCVSRLRRHTVKIARPLELSIGSIFMTCIPRRVGYARCMTLPEILTTPKTRRRRFTVVHMYFGEMCRSTDDTATTVYQKISGFGGHVRGWPDKTALHQHLAEFMATSERGDSFQIADLACVVRQR